MNTKPDDCEESTSCTRCHRQPSWNWQYISKLPYCQNCFQIVTEALAIDDAINAKILERLGNRGPEYDEPGGER